MIKANCVVPFAVQFDYIPDIWRGLWDTSPQLNKYQGNS